MRVIELLANHGLLQSLREVIGDDMSRETANLEIRASQSNAHRRCVYFPLLRPRDDDHVREPIVAPLSINVRVTNRSTTGVHDVRQMRDLRAVRAAVAHRIGGISSVPHYIPRVAPDCSIQGRSFQLAYAIGILGRLFPRRMPPVAICATGQVEADGTVSMVGGLDEKLQAIEKELPNLTIDGYPPIVLVPHGLNGVPSFARAVRHVDEAAEAVLGQARLHFVPFKGMEPYETQDARLFLERDSLQSELTQRILSTDAPLILLGPSGSGKSSLLAAGIAPALVGRRVLPVLLKGSGGPMETLATALNTHVSNLSFKESGAAISGLRAYLRLHPNEQLALLYDDVAMFRSDSGGSDGTHHADFAEHLAKLCEEQSNLSIVVAARHSDASFATELFSTHAASIVRPLSRDRLSHALRQTAGGFGYRWEESTLKAVVDGAYETQAPMLIAQFVARRLAETAAEASLDQKALKALGGVEGAIAQYAEGVLDELETSESREAALVLLAELARAKRPLSREELLGSDDPTLDPAVVAAAMRHLEHRRLIVVDDDDPDQITLVYDRLEQHWRPLQELLRQPRSQRQQRRGYLERQRLWESADRPAKYLLDASELEGLRGLRRTLTEAECALLDESEKKRRRRDLWRLGAIAAGVIIGLVGSNAALYFMGVFDDLHDRNAKLAAELESTRTELSGANEDLHRKRSEIESLRGEIERKQERLEGQLEEARLLAATADSCEDLRMASEEQRQDLRQTLRASRQRREEVMRQLASEEAVRGALYDLWNTEMARSQEFESKLNAAREEMGDLQTSLTAKEDARTEAMARANRLEGLLSACRAAEGGQRTAEGEANRGTGTTSEENQVEDSSSSGEQPSNDSARESGPTALIGEELRSPPRSSHLRRRGA